MNIRKKVEYLLLSAVVVLIFLYICSIFSVNFGGRASNDYDIYSDSILAKYMSTEKTLFPRTWHFGNQVYTVATPVVASLLYPLLGDCYSAMAAASCVMTILIILSFLWCVKPFLKPGSMIVGLLVLIGGTNIGLTAHKNLDGLQIFYTMASYYACYVIGIFLTLGVYNRYSQNLPLSGITLLAAIALNFALGMQSLREMLVLNLPLCAIASVQILMRRLKNREDDNARPKAWIFAVLALLSNAAGLIGSRILKAKGVFTQSDILQETQADLWRNAATAWSAFCEYVGLVMPYDRFTAFRFAAAVLSVAVVVTALIVAVIEFIRKRDAVIAFDILFFLTSLVAVFFAGILILQLRPIYYFCWYLMSAFCVMYLLDRTGSRFPEAVACCKQFLIAALIGISMLNYPYLFGYSYRDISSSVGFYEKIVQQLQKDGIKYIYTDSWSEQSMIATMSKDEVTYVVLSFSGDPEDLWNKVPYLYSDDWFASENYEDAYILLTDQTMERLGKDFTSEYRTVFMENLQLAHTFEGNRTTVYLYHGTPKMYRDMIN